MGRLAKKRAIVTGANRNIGRAIALALSREGADVAISYRSDREGAEAVIEEIRSHGNRAKAFFADFREGAEAFYDQAATFLGGVDLLVNNAAGYAKAPFLETNPAQFEDLFHIGVSIPMQLSQMVVRKMAPGGAILNISSISAFRPAIEGAAHCTAKAALNMLTQVMALELKPLGIRVNGIAPGSIPYEPQEEEGSLRQFGLPSDIAEMALFLLSDAAPWITGQTVVVDGGESL